MPTYWRVRFQLFETELGPHRQGWRGGTQSRNFTNISHFFIRSLPFQPQRSGKAEKIQKKFSGFLPVLPRSHKKFKFSSTTFVVHTFYRGIESRVYIRYIPKRNLVDWRCGEYLEKMCRAKTSCTFFVQFVMHHFRAC